MRQNRPDEDDHSSPQNDMPIVPLSALFIFFITLFPTLINFLGTYLGYASMSAMGVDFSHEKTIAPFRNATNQTANHTDTIKDTDHAVCGTANTNFVNASDFAWISALSVLPIFFLFSISVVFYRLACGKRIHFKDNLQHDTYFVPGMNFPLSAFLPATAGFFIFCFEIMDALKIAGACFFGSNAIMLFILLTAYCANAARNCHSPSQPNENNVATTPTTTRVIEVQTPTRRLSNQSLQSISPHDSSSALFTPRSPEASLAFSNPLSTSQRSDTPPPRQGPGHERTPTKTYIEERNGP